LTATLAVAFSMDLTRAEHSLLRQLGLVGGRHRFRPDGISRSAYAAFNRHVVSVLESLETKGLVAIDRPGSRAIGLRGSSNYASVAVEMTNAGRAAVG
jgi:hypothetical protein